MFGPLYNSVLYNTCLFWGGKCKLTRSFVRIWGLGFVVDFPSEANSIRVVISNPLTAIDN